METGLFDVLGVAGPALLLALVVLVSMVHLELGPFTHLETPGKWLLTAALGAGVLAFIFKMSVALYLNPKPDRLLVLPHPDFSRRAAALPGPAAVLQYQPYQWLALPARAPGAAADPALVELGRQLFNETALSADGRLTCASCHDLLAAAGADGQPRAVGIGAQVGPRNSPTVWNSGFQSVLFWDGRAPSLEAQATGPILNPVEMGLSSGAEAERRLQALPAYGPAFRQAFGDPDISFTRVARALAAYERTLVTADSPYDRYVQGDQNALDPAQLRGMRLFQETGCINCHRGPAFSDASLLEKGAPLRIFPAFPNPLARRYGLDQEAGQPPGPRAWRVPSLRNVALTGPYFHNGRVRELKEAIRIMAVSQLDVAVPGVTPRQRFLFGADGQLQSVAQRSLSEADIDDLAAFLESLSSARLKAALISQGGRSGA